MSARPVVPDGAAPAMVAWRRSTLDGARAIGELAVCCALLFGLVEVAVLIVQRLYLGRIFDLGPDFVWMTPLANLLLVTATAFLLVPAYAIGRVRARFDPFPGVVFAFLLLGFINLLLMVPRLHHYATLLLALGIAARTTGPLVARRRAFVSFARRSIPIMVAVVAIMALGVRGWTSAQERRALATLPPAAADDPNVVLIVLDTVRAKNLSVYGYARPTTPNLERLATTSVVFERALSTAPWTLPAHASMFTGRLPHELSADWKRPLDAAHGTLAEALRQRGYLTAGFVANTGYGSSAHGLARGFTHYEDYQVSLGQIVQSSTLTRTIATNFRLRTLLGTDEHLNRQSAEQINARALRWLSGKTDRPFFVFLNYYDAHGPYLPPPPFDTKFGPRRSGNLSPIHRWNFMPGAPAPAPQDVEAEQAAYDGAIAYLDHHLGRLVADLHGRGILDNTLVIVTSDHGEEFGEHGLFDHGNSLYLASLHVPLLISFPARVPAARISRPVSLRDLPATVMDIVDEARPSPFPGRSLARHWHAPGGPASVPDEPLVAHVSHASGLRSWFPVSKGDLRSVTLDKRRYIQITDGTEELYDFDHDYWETRNLATDASAHGELGRLRAVLEGLAGTVR